MEKKAENIKLKLIIMNFFQFAVWGAYLTSQGRYLGSVGFDNIGLFYSVQGIVSIFMPAIIGIIADKWVPAQKLLGICHLLAGLGMVGAGVYGVMAGAANTLDAWTLFSIYTFSVAFYMPTIALSNSVAYKILTTNQKDVVSSFPSIRVWGTIGFIASMWFVNLMQLDGIKFQLSSLQYITSGVLGLLLSGYCFTLPSCPISKKKNDSLADAMGLTAFKLFKDKNMAVFFIFSMFLGVALQITNGYANPFLGDFGLLDVYKGNIFVEYSNILLSLSQIAETLGILLIPYFMRKFGIKNVMLMAMFAWVLRFAFFGLGNPGYGVWLFILSMLVYGIAFDFFNISGSLYLEKHVDESIRNSSQGLFMLMTNGLGASIGMFGAQWVVNKFVNVHPVATDVTARMAGWSSAWYIFAAYALVVAILFMIFFKYKHNTQEQ